MKGKAVCFFIVSYEHPFGWIFINMPIVLFGQYTIQSNNNIVYYSKEQDSKDKYYSNNIVYYN